MDLANITVKETVDVNIDLPDGTPTDIVITAYTTDSKQYKAIIHKMQNENLYSKRKKRTAEQIERKGIETVAKCTASWKNYINKGEIVECNKDNALELYTQHAWILDQVDIGMGARADFLEITPES